jgi:hypothetical protein
MVFKLEWQVLQLQNNFRYMMSYGIWKEDPQFQEVQL